MRAFLVGVAQLAWGSSSEPLASVSKTNWFMSISHEWQRFALLVGCYCSYLPPKQGCGTSLISVNCNLTIWADEPPCSFSPNNIFVVWDHLGKVRTKSPLKWHFEVMLPLPRCAPFPPEFVFVLFATISCMVGSSTLWKCVHSYLSTWLGQVTQLTLEKNCCHIGLCVAGLYDIKRFVLGIPPHSF